MPGPSLPLRGLRVLDLSTGIAGPYAAKVLRDFGAEVLKIEEPGGDPTRTWTASYDAVPEGEDAGLFQFLNGGKAGGVVDLRTGEGRTALDQLVREADVLIESFGARGRKERGLADLAERHPRLSVVSISWWGLEGPWADRPANEWTLQASIGMTARRGYPEQGPVGSAGRFGEWSAGSCAAVAALSAWMTARRTGRGEHVDLSVFETMLLCMTQYHTLDGQFRPGDLPPYVECPSIEKTKDGWVGLCCVTPPQWQAFTELMERPEWGENPKLVAADERMKFRDTLHRDIIEWMAERTTAEVVEQAALRRIPVSPIGMGANIAEMEQVLARGLLETAPGGFLQPRPPIQLHGIERRPLQRAPSLGKGLPEAFSEPRAETDASAPEDGWRPLAGVRVLDLSAFWAGPMCTSILAALGADVVKVEAGKRPDGMRFVNTMPIEAFWETGSIFHGANLGKKGITIALDLQEGVEIFEKLVADADVLVENFSVRVMQNFGFTKERLHEINPRLTFVRMPSWGLEGPWRDRVGFAMTIEQCCGIGWISGYENRPLTVNVCDSVGALHTVFGILASLESVRQTGEGRLVEVPLVEPGLNIGAELIIEASRGKEVPREGNRGPLGAPQGCYRGSDEQWVALCVETDEQWLSFVEALGAPAWTTSSSLLNVAGRRTAHDTIDQEIAEWCAQQSAAEAEALLLAAGIPSTVLHNAHGVLPHPQLEARGFFEPFSHAFAGNNLYPTLPWRASWASEGWYLSPPPTLGQHNSEVIGDGLGLTPDELSTLEEKGVISTKLG